MSELRPCPCGDYDVKIWKSGDAKFNVMCDGCYLATRQFDTPDEAVAAWNHRPVEDALIEVLENIIDGNDLACERKQTLESWPYSHFRKMGRAALKLTKEGRNG